MNNQDWDDFQLGAEVKRYIETSRRTHLELRQAMMLFAPVLCTCTRWYNWREPEAPQLDCMVHTTVMFDNGNWV